MQFFTINEAGKAKNIKQHYHHNNSNQSTTFGLSKSIFKKCILLC
jgi:hypothetical protein